MAELTLQMLPTAAVAVDLTSGRITGTNTLADEALGADISALVGRRIQTVIMEWTRFVNDSDAAINFLCEFQARTRRTDGQNFVGTWRIGPSEPDGRHVVAMLVHGAAMTPWRRRATDKTALAPATGIEGIDHLTGLANRWALENLVSAALDDSTRAATPFGLLLIDLDNFKPVNDRLGHIEGDRVLEIVAERLVTNVRPTDLVTRYGGDEFIVYANPICAREDMHRIAERIVSGIRAPIRTRSDIVEISASVGIAYGSEAASLLGLVEIADRAMYTAKRRGGDRFYDRCLEV